MTAQAEYFNNGAMLFQQIIPHLQKMENENEAVLESLSRVPSNANMEFSPTPGASIPPRSETPPPGRPVSTYDQPPSFSQSSFDPNSSDSPTIDRYSSFDPNVMAPPSYEAPNQGKGDIDLTKMSSPPPQFSSFPPSNQYNPQQSHFDPNTMPITPPIPTRHNQAPLNSSYDGGSFSDGNAPQPFASSKPLPSAPLQGYDNIDLSTAPVYD